jgi:hypothetical protein
MWRCAECGQKIPASWAHGWGPGPYYGFYLSAQPVLEKGDGLIDWTFLNASIVAPLSGDIRDIPFRIFAVYLEAVCR